MKYEFILVDIDDTILDFKLAERCAFIKTHEDYGVAFGEQDYAVYSEINHKLWLALEKGEIPSSSYIINNRFNQYCAKRNIGNLGEKFRIAYEKNLSENAFVFNDGVVETLEFLKDKTTIYSITNGTFLVQSKRVKKSGIEKYLTKQFISEKVGFKKPDKRFFDFVENNIPNFKKEKALVVGDSLTADMPAIQFGYDTCFINRKNVDISNFPYPPTYCIKEFSELKNIILKD